MAIWIFCRTYLKLFDEGNREGKSFSRPSSGFDDDVISGHALSHSLVLLGKKGEKERCLDTGES